METSDVIATFALVVSIGSLLVSACSLIYTYIVDHRRAKLRVKAEVIHILDRGPDSTRVRGPFFCVKATNLGPGRINVQGLALRQGSPLLAPIRHRLFGTGKTQMGVLDTSPESSHRLPTWLEMGEALSLLYPIESPLVTQKAFDRMYLYDSLGNDHYVPKKVLKEARELAAAEPGDEEPEDEEPEL